MRKFFYFWFPVFLYSGIIFYGSSLSGVPTPLGKFRFDKILHVVEYIPFGFLMARAVGNTHKVLSKRAVWGIVVVLSFAYGVSDEYHQSFVPGRESDWLDLVADTVGGGIGGLIYSRINSKGWYKKR